MGQEPRGAGAFRSGRAIRPEGRRARRIESRDGEIVIRRQAVSDEAREQALRAVEDIIARRKGVTLGGISIKELINEGRKR
jgi:hypothetical protein